MPCHESSAISDIVLKVFLGFTTPAVTDVIKYDHIIRGEIRLVCFNVLVFTGADSDIYIKQP